MKKTTTEVLEEMKREFKARMSQEREAFESSLEFVRDTCNAGLVDDVEPDGPPPEALLTITCGHCGKTITGPAFGGPDWVSEHLDTHRE